MPEAISSKAPEVHDWTTKSKEEITQSLLSILESRASHSPSESAARADELRNAIRKLPTLLDSTLSAAGKAFTDAGVKSYTVFIAGGFARETSAEKIEPHTSIDTSIRSDTDIDVGIACTSKDGARVHVSVIPSPFSPILYEWQKGELGNIVELAFSDANRPSKTHASKPRILLWSRDVSTT
jgi:hypothetical protein